MKGSEKPNPAAIARGKRLREVRDAMRLSRDKLATACDISSSTVQSWEIARYGGLTAGGAANVCRYFTENGLPVDTGWLLYGEGKNPLTGEEDPVARAVLSKPTDERTKIQQELKLFRHHCSDAIDIIVPDDGLAPIISKGDHAAGERCFEEEIESTIGQPAIVQFATGEMLVRIIQAGKTKGRYELHCLNKDASVPQKQTDVELFSAAVVKWVRRVG